MTNRLPGFIILLILFAIETSAQTAAAAYNFIDFQKSIPKITDVLQRKQDTLMKQFRQKGLQWPAKNIYIRSFKYDSKLEVWVKAEKNQQFKLFKTYKVCAMAGTLGPKRMQGDYQVPEGFYHINEFNPNSLYHLSLGLNYPNLSDKMLSDSLQPGGDIYIHGSCVTTGCIPITNPQIEELYILAAFARNQGQDFIPVHIFPIDFQVPKSEEYLKKYLQTFSEYAAFASQMKNAYYYFQKYKQLPIVQVNEKGDYIFDDEALPKPIPQKAPYVKKKRIPVPFDESEIPVTVNTLPVYAGGNQAFQELLKKMNDELSVLLPKENKTVYVQVEFIITKEGNVVNPKVIRGGTDEINDQILDILEAMPKWTPAIRQEKNVPIKLKQTIIIEKN
ncbi:MAG TPA: L,D-transpeptidase family protein [Chitinophagaceae bacterium]|nr:L,D-transpeptidase family protein [Chitinophagaceae bacterium]